MKTWILGDLHGCYKGLKQVLERSGFNKEEDLLITLGDIVDGWSEVYECVEELLTIKNRIDIIGNHDKWFHEWLQYNRHPCDWLQGGHGTLISYCRNLDKKYTTKMSGWITNLLNTDLPESHIKFFNKQVKYYKDDNNNLFVHGGFNRHFLLNEQYDNSIFWWDRDLWMQALSYKEMPGMSGRGTYKFKTKESLKEIFIGHTTTMNWSTKEEKSKSGIIISKGTSIDYPINAANIWNLDTGAGFKGKLTIMNIDTKEYFQSDEVSEMYNNEKGRN